MHNVRWLFVLILCASCSAGSNKDMSLTHGTGRRDAATDPVAVQDEDAEVDEADAAVDEPEEDASAPVLEDAAAPEADAGGDERLDAALDASDGAAPDAMAADTGDAGSMDGGDAAGDSASPADAGPDAADGGATDAGSDAGNDAAVGRVLINFEGLTAMPNSLIAVPPASRVSDGFRASTGAVFSSSAPFIAVVSLGQGHANSGVNGIGGANSDGYLSYSTPIRVTFVAPGDASVPATTSFVKLRGDHSPANGVATMIAYDLAGAEIGRTQANDTSAGLTLQLELAGIHAIVVSQTQANIAFDDLEFAIVTPVQ